MKSIAARTFMVLASLGISAAQPVSAQSESAYPTKPVRMVIPFAPGGGSDFFGRVIADKLRDRLGKPLVVENKGGVGGAIGAEMVAKSEPDGYTILIHSNSFAVGAAVSKLPYDPITDFAPIVRLVDTAMVVAVHPSVPANDLKELVAYATANPNKLAFGSSGLGGIAHLATEEFLVTTGTRMVHVPYKGTGPANTALLAGEVQLNIGDVGAVAALVKAGRVKALAVGGTNRSKQMPSVPTSKESGYPTMKLDIWYGLLAPRGTPEKIVALLNKEVNDILRLPDVVDAFTGRFGTPAGGSPQEFASNIKQDVEFWKKFIDRTKLKLN